MTDAPAAAEVCLAEMLGVLSLGADLGLGQPMEHALRQCVIARRMGEQLGLSAAELDVRWDITPTGDGVRLTVSWDGHPKTFGRKLFAAPLRRRMLRREVSASLDTIRRILESTGAEAA